MKYYNILVGTLVVILVFLLGVYVGERDYSDFNLQWYKDANATKGELLDNMEAERYLFYKLIFDNPNDVGQYDELKDDLENLGLFELRHNIDSICDSEI